MPCFLKGMLNVRLEDIVVVYLVVGLGFRILPWQEVEGLPHGNVRN